MTITIDAPAEVEAAIIQDAERAGLSVSEYALLALLEKSKAHSSEEQDARERAKQEMIARVRSGYYIRSQEVSSDRLIADRREDLRLEAEQEARRLAARDVARA